MVRREEKDDHVLRALARLKTTLYREFLALDHPNVRVLYSFDAASNLAVKLAVERSVVYGQGRGLRANVSAEDK